MPELWAQICFSGHLPGSCNHWYKALVLADMGRCTSQRHPVFYHVTRKSWGRELELSAYLHLNLYRKVNLFLQKNHFKIISPPSTTCYSGIDVAFFYVLCSGLWEAHRKPPQGFLLLLFLFWHHAVHRNRDAGGHADWSSPTVSLYSPTCLDFG